MFRPLLKILSLSFLVFLAGCGRGETPAPRITIAAPHGGFLVDLPDGKGYVELISEVVGSKPGKKSDQSVIAVYFISPDGKSAISPAPSDVSFKLSINGAENSVSLQPLPKDKADPIDAGRFASAPGNYSARSEVQGELTATLDGAAVALPIQSR
jgi:hypothetical protein